jgi:hypothetical protein
MTVLRHFRDSYESATVAASGQWMGCVSSHVHPNRLLVWVTLEELSALLTV